MGISILTSGSLEMRVRLLSGLILDSQSDSSMYFLALIWVSMVLRRWCWTLGFWLRSLWGVRRCRFCFRSGNSCACCAGHWFKCVQIFFPMNLCSPCWGCLVLLLVRCRGRWWLCSKCLGLYFFVVAVGELDWVWPECFAFVFVFASEYECVEDVVGDYSFVGDGGDGEVCFESFFIG